MTRTKLIQFLSPLLFFAPDRYLRQLRFLDWKHIIEQPEDWLQFIATVEKPWNDLLLANEHYTAPKKGVNVSGLEFIEVIESH